MRPINNINTILLLFLSVCLMTIWSSCSDNVHYGDWVTTENGFKVFLPDSLVSDYNGIYHWNGGQSLEQVADGRGVLTYKEEDNPEKNFQIKEYFIYGAPQSLFDSLEYHNYIGNLDSDSLPHGYGVYSEYLSTDSAYLISYGTFKHGEFEKGLRAVYKNGIFQFSVDGQFKDGKSYGICTYTDYSTGNTLTCKFKDGQTDSTSLARIEQICAVYEIGSTGRAADSAVSRYLFFERHKTWIYIGVGVMLLIFLIPFTLIPNTKKYEWQKEHYPAKPWRFGNIFFYWLFLRIFSVHRYKLRAYWYALVTACLLVASVVFFLPELIIYGPSPAKWPYLFDNYLINKWYVGFPIVTAALWTLDLFWIPYRCYVLNFKVYRRDLYELDILRGRKSLLESFYSDLPEKIRRLESKLDLAFSRAQEEYDDELSWVSKGLSWLTNSKVRHARKKMEALDECQSVIRDTAWQYERIANNLGDYLDIARKNAYRNIKLVKELIALTKVYQGKKQTLKFDKKISIDVLSTNTADYYNSDDYIADYSSSVETFQDTFNSLYTGESSGDPKTDLWELGADLAISAIAGAFDGIINENERRTQERAALERASANIIASITKTVSSINENQAKMLRANELLIALGKANVAFVKTYVPLRDMVFGKEPSIANFLSRAKLRPGMPEHKKFIQDLGYLIKLCSEYNKINQTKY